MHGRKKSDLPQTKEEKDALQAKISNYKKVSRTFEAMFSRNQATRADRHRPFKNCTLSPLRALRSASLACLIGGLSLGRVRSSAINVHTAVRPPVTLCMGV